MVGRCVCTYVNTSMYLHASLYLGWGVDQREKGVVGDVQQYHCPTNYSPLWMNTCINLHFQDPLEAKFLDWNRATVGRSQCCPNNTNLHTFTYLCIILCTTVHIQCAYCVYCMCCVCCCVYCVCFVHCVYCVMCVLLCVLCALCVLCVLCVYTVCAVCTMCTVCAVCNVCTVGTHVLCVLCINTIFNNFTITTSIGISKLRPWIKLSRKWMVLPAGSEAASFCVGSHHTCKLSVWAVTKQSWQPHIQHHLHKNQYTLGFIGGVHSRELCYCSTWNFYQIS